MNSNKCQIVLVYGLSGAGKETFIKYMTAKEVEIIALDSSDKDYKSILYPPVIK